MTLIRKYRGARTSQPFDSAKIESLLSYYNRTADRTVILDEIVNRYARAIVQPKDLLTDERGADPKYEIVRTATEQAIRTGLYEVVMLRWLQRVCVETATLYTEPGTSWQYVDSDGNEFEEVAEMVADYRERSGFDTALPIVDAMSVAIGTEAVYCTYESRKLRYQALPLSRFHVRFPMTVEDNGADRPANGLNLDDAECVTIMLEGAISTQENAGTARYLFVSWHGASDKWPMGRVCMWEGSDVTEVPPEPGLGVQDYTAAGFADNAATDDCINPLTLAAIDSDSEWDHPEYPIALFYDDGIAQSDTLLRTTGLSRFDLSKEVDIAASRLTTSMLKSARGVFAIQNPKGAPLPNGWDEGMVQLVRDQLLQVFDHPTTNSSEGLKMLREIMRSAAEADGVAGYLVAGDTGQEIASGRALMVATAPMVRRRNGRIRVNKAAQSRLFEIERAWINYSGEDAIPWDLREIWTPGELTFPGDSQIDEQVSQTQYADKAIDRVERTRRALALDTRDDAKAAIDRMLEDAKGNEEYGWPASSKQQGPPSNVTTLAQRALARKGAQNGQAEKRGAPGPAENGGENAQGTETAERVERA